MDNFLKAAALAAITVVLYLVLSKQNKDLATVISLAACCLILMMAVSYLEPVIVFAQQLESLGNLNRGFLEILLKSTGIGLLAQIAAMICTDAGNSALGKAIHILAIVTILWMALPLFSGLLELMNEILGGT